MMCPEVEDDDAEIIVDEVKSGSRTKWCFNERELAPLEIMASRLEAAPNIKCPSQVSCHIGTYDR